MDRGPATLEDIIDAQWGKDNVPYSHGLSVDEPFIEELGMKRCRSFRADLIHKLRVIQKAGGGTFRGAAYLLKVPAATFSSWINLEKAPRDRATFERIDTAYEGAIVKLTFETKKQLKKGKTQ